MVSHSSPESLHAAQLYLTMGPTRSLGKVGVKLGKSLTLIERWSARDGWVQQAADYDNKMVEAKIRGHEKVAEREGAVEARLAEKMLKVSERSMDAYLQDDPLMIRPKDASQIAKDAVAIKKMVSGETTEQQRPVVQIVIVEGRTQKVIDAEYTPSP